jgi:hypothetical protein
MNASRVPVLDTKRWTAPHASVAALLKTTAFVPRSIRRKRKEKDRKMRERKRVNFLLTIKKLVVTY